MARLKVAGHVLRWAGATAAHGLSGVYGLHGLRLRSELALAGFALAGAADDLDVRRVPAGPVPNRLPPGDPLLQPTPGDRSSGYLASEHGRAVTLRVPGRCEFAIDRERRVVTCQTDPGADERLTGVLVAGLVVALVLSLDGHPVLHASAVQIDEVVIAFAGPSGAGKSTLAALMCAAGARLVSDDLLRVEQVGDQLVCVPGGPQLRLRPHAAWAIEGLAGPSPPEQTVDGRLALSPPAAETQRLPLRAIVVPRLTASVDRAALRTLTGGEAVRALAGAHRIAGWARPEAQRRQFEQTVGLARRASVVEATIPRGPASRHQIVGALLELCRPQATVAAAARA